MKTLIIFAAGALLAGSAFAQAPEANISAPTVQRRALPPVSAAQTEGGLQRGVRLGNPVQMFNPFAPAEYGSGRDFVSPRDEETARPRDRVQPRPVALRLFSFSF